MPEPIQNPHVALNNARNLPREVQIGTLKHDEASEFWWATQELRRHIHYLIAPKGAQEKTLQQKWASNLGNEKWEDIPLVITEQPGL